MPRAASAPTTGLEMPRSAKDFKLDVLLIWAIQGDPAAPNARKAQRKRNLSGGDWAKPDRHTVAGDPFWPAVRLFLTVPGAISPAARVSRLLHFSDVLGSRDRAHLHALQAWDRAARRRRLRRCRRAPR